MMMSPLILNVMFYGPQKCKWKSNSLAALVILTVGVTIMASCSFFVKWVQRRGRRFTIKRLPKC
jgi:hypothetical protein